MLPLHRRLIVALVLVVLGCLGWWWGGGVHTEDAGSSIEARPDMSKANEVLAPLVSPSTDRLPTPDQGVVQSGGKFQANRGMPPSGGIPSAEAMKEVARSYIKEVGPNELRVGEVRLLKRERTITFTATVAVRTQPLEYALVHETGKAHEALLVTKVPVQDVHVAVLLLEASGQAPMIEVSWRKHGGETRMPLTDLIQVQRVAPDVLKANPWTYNGSEFSHGSFAAMREGSLVALVNDPAALVNHRAAASLMRDDVFFANPAKLPPDGVPVSVIFVFTGNK